MLARLGHRPVCGRDHEYGPVHLGCPRDHVLDVVGVPRAVHVGVVPVLGGVLLMRSGDRDPALLLLGSVVYLVESHLAVVSVVLPWSTWRMVPTFRCGLVLSNTPLDILGVPFTLLSDRTRVAVAGLEPATRGL